MTRREMTGRAGRAAALLALALTGVVASSASAQEEAEGPELCAPLVSEAPGAAPVDTTSLMAGEAVVRACFRARSARGRPVFGHSQVYEDTRWLVQYDSLWNAGVLLEVDAAVRVAGIEVDPGVYGLYAVPSAREWVVMLAAPSAYGEGGRYAEGSVVGRALVPSSATPSYHEHLVVSGQPSGSASADLVLAWERTEVRIPVRETASLDDLACEFRGDPEAVSERASPGRFTDFTLGGEPARICYGSPSARERQVFGGLVPYDDLWRTGANEPTVLHLPVPATVAGIEVPAGRYTIASIPSPDEWVIVVNGSTAQWGRVTPTPRGGRSQYGAAVRGRELGRALVPSGSTEEHVEAFTIAAEPSGADGVDLVLEWERTRVRVPVERR